MKMITAAWLGFEKELLEIYLYDHQPGPLKEQYEPDCGL